MGLEPKVPYRAFYFDPRDGCELDLDPAEASDTGEWQPPKPPIFQDWVLVMAQAR